VADSILPVACIAEDTGAEGELWQALGMPGSPFESLPELPDLIRRDLFGPLDLLLALAGHLARVRSLSWWQLCNGLSNV
jgi:hypothetical protein